MNIFALAVHLHCMYNNIVPVTNISFVPRAETMTCKKHNKDTLQSTVHQNTVYMISRAVTVDALINALTR